MDLFNGNPCLRLTASLTISITQYGMFGATYVALMPSVADPEAFLTP
jgi:hypothetical protein